MNTVTKTAMSTKTKIVLGVAAALAAGGLAMATIPLLKSSSSGENGKANVSSVISIAPRTYAPGSLDVEIGRVQLEATGGDVLIDEIALGTVKNRILNKEEDNAQPVLFTPIFSTIRIKSISADGTEQVIGPIQPSSEDTYGNINYRFGEPYVVKAFKVKEIILYGDMRTDALMDGPSNQLTIFFSYKNGNAQQAPYFTMLQPYSLACGDVGQRACPPGNGYNVSYCLRNKNLKVDPSGFCTPICPPGTVLLGTGECSPGTSLKIEPEPTPILCGDNGQKACQPGENNTGGSGCLRKLPPLQKDSSGVCRLVCPEGTYPDASSGKCTAPTSLSVPSSTACGNSGQSACPIGTPATYFGCFPPFVSDGNTCVSCSSGTTFDNDGRCVACGGNSQKACFNPGSGSPHYCNQGFKVVPGIPGSGQGPQCAPASEKQ
jgi:hypothetical protein